MLTVDILTILLGISFLSSSTSGWDGWGASASFVRSGPWFFRALATALCLGAGAYSRLVASKATFFLSLAGFLIVPLVPLPCPLQLFNPVLAWF
jgi:hypothetical protein